MEIRKSLKLSEEDIFALRRAGAILFLLKHEKMLDYDDFADFLECVDRKRTTFDTSINWDSFDISYEDTKQALS